MLARLHRSLALLLFFALILFGGLQYRLWHFSLLNQIDHSLLERAEFLKGKWSNSQLDDASLENIIPGGHPTNEIHKVFLEIVDSSGRMLIRSENLGKDNLPISPGPVQPGFYEGLSPNGQRLRIYQEPLDRSHWLRLAEPLQMIDRALAQVTMALFGVGFLIVMATLWVTRQIVRRGFRPFTTISETSKDLVTQGDLSFRLTSTGDCEFRDLTNSINDLLSRVEELHTSQKRLLSDTSHELRNPLTVLRTDLDMLGKEIPLELRHEIVHESQKEVDRLVRLVEDLLLLSWAESRPRIEFENFSLVPLLARAIKRASRIAGQRTVRLEAAPVTVSADADRTLQIVMNLLENAIRHTREEGQIILSWESGSDHDRPGCVVLVVQDDGSGILPEHLEKIFDRFYRVDASRTRALGGTGLGLPVARALARAMGGDLWATSVPGQGCCFFLSLQTSR